ncbi:MAG TPA: L,D-transpeptidase [Xanthobacteraceae bacterium]|jgi:lipoprotein-anchoring transpeptidase ErfK/SrfK
MFQHASFVSLLYLSAVLASGTALADPLAANSAGQGGLARQNAGTAPVRQAAAQADLGGGFIEFLFRGQAGASRSAREATATTYPQYPADLGPGMVESPGQPGQIVMDPRFLRQEVGYQGAEAPGTIIINTQERMLYLVETPGRALRYGIGVGRPGFTWSGVHRISEKREWPDWTPPDEMLKRRPDLPRHMAGGPDNPLGARAMYLGSTLYRIHGSNEPWTIGTQISSGCIRMRNEDVIDLYGRVKIGTKVVVI